MWFHNQEYYDQSADNNKLEMCRQIRVQKTCEQVFDPDQHICALQQRTQGRTVVGDDFGNTKCFFTGLRISSHI